MPRMNGTRLNPSDLHAAAAWPPHLELHHPFSLRESHELRHPFELRDSLGMHEPFALRDFLELHHPVKLRESRELHHPFEVHDSLELHGPFAQHDSLGLHPTLRAAKSHHINRIHSRTSPNGAADYSPGSAEPRRGDPGLSQANRKANPAPRHTLPATSSVCILPRHTPAAQRDQQHRHPR